MLIQYLNEPLAQPKDTAKTGFGLWRNVTFSWNIMTIGWWRHPGNPHRIWISSRYRPCYPPSNVGFGFGRRQGLSESDRTNTKAFYGHKKNEPGFLRTRSLIPGLSDWSRFNLTLQDAYTQPSFLKQRFLRYLPQVLTLALILSQSQPYPRCLLLEQKPFGPLSGCFFCSCNFTSKDIVNGTH